ncbi:MAG: MBL fold metallo-hydrolase [Clostridia bacterium]|nr:MBL fold metallo-hydrolase [Clostridia bacterium]
MKKIFKTIVPVVLAVLVLAGGAGIWAWQRAALRDATDGKLQLHFIDVGQADAALLILPTGERIMIDTGTKESGEAILSHLAKWDVGALDLVILSHNHDDHAGGLPVIADAMPVGGVLYSGEVPADCGVPMRAVSAGYGFSIGEVQFSILGPLSEEGTENRSMILRIDYGVRSFLFTGDAEAGEEELLLEKAHALLNVDLLKVAHHGSATSSTEAFLAAVSPEVAVISASADNDFGHPSPQTVNRLKALDCMIYRTDWTGTLVFLCDGTVLSRYIR